MSIFFYLQASQNASNAVFFFYILFLAALGLNCCTWTFSSCAKQGLLSSCGMQASH